MKTTNQKRVNIPSDHHDNRIIPTSTFRAQMTERLKQVKSSQRPIILTSHGYGEAAVVPLAMLEDMEGIIGAAEGAREIQNGNFIEQDQLFANLKRKYGL